MLSVAMTTYNGEKYIEKQLVSIYNQKRKVDEVVIVDDCSTDSTVEIINGFIKKYELKNWKVYINSENLGYKRNFYRSIQKTQGDFIFLCDQDDEWKSNKIAEMERIFLTHENVCALSSGFSLINSVGESISYNCRKGSYNNDLIRGKCIEAELKKISYDIIMKYNISPGCTTAFRKCIKDIYIKNSECKLPHDWEINIIAAVGEGLFFYNKPLIKYRIHSKNTLGMNTDDRISDFEFKGNIDFRKKALEDRILFRRAMQEWNQKLPITQAQKRVYAEIINYDKCRMECVYYRSLMAWFKLIYWTIRLWDGKHVRYKTIFGDLYYIIRGTVKDGQR